MNTNNKWENFHDSRLKELLSDITEINDLDYFLIGELVCDQWKDSRHYIDNISMVVELKEHFESLAEFQVISEWSEK